MVTAIEPAGNWGFGPCATQHGVELPGGNMRYNQCYSTTPTLLTQGRYCDSKGNYIYNCSDSCACMEGYYCSPETGACARCDNGEACFAIQENGLVESAGDFLLFMPSMFPLMLVFAVGILAFWLMDMLRHIDEYAQ